MKKKILAAVLAASMAAGSVLGAMPADENVFAAELDREDLNLSPGEGVVTASEATPGKVEVEFTAISSAEGYEIHRISTPMEGESKLGEIAADSDKWETVFLGDPLYEEDFEDVTVEATGTDGKLKKAGDYVSVANPASSKIAGQNAIAVEPDNAGDSETKILYVGAGGDGTAVQNKFADPISENVELTFDIRMDASDSTKTNVFALLGVPVAEESGLRWMTENSGGAKATDVKPIFMLSATAGAAKELEKVTVNEFPAAGAVDITEKAVVADSNALSQGGDTQSTGWLHVELGVDFDSKKTNVSITRDGSKVYENANLDFAYDTDQLAAIYVTGDKSFGGNSLDNIVIDKPQSAKPQVKKTTYADTTAKAGVTYRYQIVAKFANGDTYTYESAEIQAKDATKELKDYIASVKDKKEADYTAETWAAFQKALKAAEDVAAKTAPTNKEISDAYENLKTAVEGLKKAVKVSAIKIEAKGETELKVNGTVQLEVKEILPANAANKEVEWKSSDATIAAVNEEGLVTAVAEGTTKITAVAKDGSEVKSNEIEIKVTAGSAVDPEKPAVTGITIAVKDSDAKEVTLTAKDATKELVVVEVTPGEAEQKVDWVSSKPEVATVNENGVVTAVANGETVITAKATDDSGIESNGITVKVEIPGGGNEPGPNPPADGDLATPQDKAALKAEIDKAVLLKQADYTAETWTAFQTALTAASAVYNKADATKAEVTKATADLTAAMNALKKAEPAATPIGEAKGKTFTDSKKNKFQVTVQGMSDGTKPEVAFTGTGAKGTTLTISPTVTINGVTYQVTSVGTGKSVLTSTQKKNVKTVKLGANVKSIGAGAFSGATKLQNLTLNNKLESIGSKAFSKCTALKKVTFPNSVKTIGTAAFSGCKKLATVKFGKNLTKIGKQAFESAAIKKLVIPDKVTEIGDKAFYKNTNMTKVTIGKGLTKIGKEAFRNCKKLNQVNIKSTKLKTVGKNAFKSVKKGAKATVPKSKKKAYTSKLKPLKVK